MSFTKKLKYLGKQEKKNKINLKVINFKRYFKVDKYLNINQPNI